MSKQTAVQWLIAEIQRLPLEHRLEKQHLYYHALKMEKEHTEENMAKAITFGWELSQHHRLNTEEKLLQMQKDFITSVIEAGSE
jgi:hypothetical protein